MQHGNVHYYVSNGYWIVAYAILIRHQKFDSNNELICASKDNALQSMYFCVGLFFCVYILGAFFLKGMINTDFQYRYLQHGIDLCRTFGGPHYLAIKQSFLKAVRLSIWT